MIAVNLAFDPADLAAVRDQMNRLISELGQAPEDAVRQGTLALLKALQSSTRRAPKTRKVVKDRVTRLNLRSGKARRVTIADSYLVEVWDRGGQPSRVQIGATSLAEAKAHPRAKIRFAGLAKASWGWSMRRLFPNQPAPAVPMPVRRNFFSVTATGSGRDHAVTVDNSLDYISKAFTTGRGPAVATAARRAAATMKGRIDQRLKGKIR